MVLPKHLTPSHDSCFLSLSCSFFSLQLLLANGTHQGLENYGLASSVRGKAQLDRCKLFQAHLFRSPEYANSSNWFAVLTFAIRCQSRCKYFNKFHHNRLGPFSLSLLTPVIWSDNYIPQILFTLPPWLIFRLCKLLGQLKSP